MWVTFLVAVTTFLTRSNFREEGLISDHGLKDFSKSGWRMYGKLMFLRGSGWKLG